MAAITTVTIKRTFCVNDQRYVEAEITGPASYTTGGDALAASLFGLSELRDLYQVCSATTYDAVTLSTLGNHGRSLRLINTRAVGTKTPLLQQFVNGAEVANATNTSTAVIRVIAVGS
jgi:hypothetical protein